MKLGRLRALDAIRGWLAVLVVVDHLLMAFGSYALELPGLIAVLTFFVMSGFVLARAYDGRLFVFLARRVVRLWPLFAVERLLAV